ncbi:MAG TPA: indole-3-glycerol phosphate synthase TrpC [Acidobacteriota bacterium]|nr:indole-3-glycerol phosphate synthase TrpC [Acidobacteriota bacterium]
MHILDQIVARKRAEVDEMLRQKAFAKLLEELPGDLIQSAPPSFSRALQEDGINIIAEIKYRSPSHGPFAIQWPPEEVAEAYRKGGAAALSVLTDESFFDGRPEYLQRLSAQQEHLPLLRKDFIVERYQIVQARIWGASAYLLIAACLTPSELADLVSCSEEYGIDALVEVHDLRELEMALEAGAKVIGVNNRDLKTFQVDLDTSFRVAREMEGEKGRLLVSESGIDEHLQIAELRDAGFSAFLVGSSLMNSEDPAATLRSLRGEDSEC